LAGWPPSVITSMLHGVAYVTEPVVAVICHPGSEGRKTLALDALAREVITGGVGATMVAAADIGMEPDRLEEWAKAWVRVMSGPLPARRL